MGQYSIKGILAGIFISIAGIIYLKVGGIPGAVLFSLGLLGVVECQGKLFTGLAGWQYTWADHAWLLFVLVFNVLGCALVAFALGDTFDTAQSYIQARMNAPWWLVVIRAIGCGILMTTAITGVKNKSYIPLLFCVPGFILAGFYHCVADAFYFCVCPDKDWSYIWTWLLTVLGNYVGCKIPRLG